MHETRISALRSLFPLMEDKKSLASSEESSGIRGKASLLAALDYYISTHIDVFISASLGNMHNTMEEFEKRTQSIISKSKLKSEDRLKAEVVSPAEWERLVCT